MPVICAVCHTENRDAAKFCHGCARKLPGFAATGPSLLDSIKVARQGAPSSRAGTADGDAISMMSAETRRLWIRIGLLILAVAVCFFGWFAYVTRKVPMRTPETATVRAPSAPPAAAAIATPSTLQSVSKPPPEPVDLHGSLSPGEIQVAPGPAAAPAPPPVAAATPHSPERRQVPRAPAPVRAAALDPRSGCETLNFIFAARCEAAHCDKPEYTRHPRCDLVRQERKRDEARRNPTLAF